MDQNNPYPDYNRNENDPYHRPAENEAGQDRKDESLGYHKPGRAITSMVLGISSVSLWFYPFLTSIPCLIMGIIAVKLASNSDGQTDPKYNGKDHRYHRDHRFSRLYADHAVCGHGRRQPALTQSGSAPAASGNRKTCSRFSYPGYFQNLEAVRLLFCLLP